MRGGRGRRRNRGQPARSRERTDQNRGGGTHGSDRCQPGDRAHVHHQTVFGARTVRAIQYPPANRTAHRRSATDALTDGGPQRSTTYRSRLPAPREPENDTPNPIRHKTVTFTPIPVAFSP